METGLVAGEQIRSWPQKLSEMTNQSRFVDVCWELACWCFDCDDFLFDDVGGGGGGGCAGWVSDWGASLGCSTLGFGLFSIVQQSRSSA